MGTAGRKLVNKDVTDLIRHPRLANGGYTYIEQNRDTSAWFQRRDKASPREALLTLGCAFL